MNNLIDLTGKTILVTGASSGIGRQTAITLSEAGAKVILTARRKEQLEETLGMTMIVFRLTYVNWKRLNRC